MRDRAGQKYRFPTLIRRGLLSLRPSSAAALGWFRLRLVAHRERLWLQCIAKQGAQGGVQFSLRHPRSLATLMSARKKPLWRQSEVIPKVNSIEMFEIPACRSTGAIFSLDEQRLTLCSLVTSLKKPPASTDNAVFVHAGVTIGKRPCGTLACFDRSCSRLVGGH